VELARFYSGWFVRHDGLELNTIACGAILHDEYSCGVPKMLFMPLLSVNLICSARRIFVNWRATSPQLLQVVLRRPKRGFNIHFPRPGLRRPRFRQNLQAELQQDLALDQLLQ